jgi:AcrR family transcriptional regulator
MTNEDIIEAAFRVWGRDLYKSTSLTQLARALHITKPALYRHFESKDALMKAMYTAYFDHYAAFLKKSYEALIQDVPTGAPLMIRSVTEYYVRYPYKFVFCLIMVFGAQGIDGMVDQLEDRGINLRKLWALDMSTEYPRLALLVGGSITFFVTLFHRSHMGEEPAEDITERFVSFVERTVRNGLGLDKNQVEGLDYEKLETLAEKQPLPERKAKVLEAVTAAVAEAGPWKVSMDMIAAKAGLSKSGLYSHFKDKREMISAMFLAEYDRIVDYSEAVSRASENSLERFYLGIIGIVNYLRAMPDVLSAMDSLRTRRIKPVQNAPDRLFRLYAGLQFQDTPREVKRFEPENHAVAKWIFFLTIHVLKMWSRNGNGDLREIFLKLPNKSLRILYKFITLGIKGL